MMDCTQYRREVLAEPFSKAGELDEHRRSCQACEEYTRRLQRFEGRLETALRVTVGKDPNARVIPARGFTRSLSRRGFALAASLVLGIGVAALLWLGTAQPSLAFAVVEHLEHEPAAWTDSSNRVPAAALAAILRDAQVRLMPGMGRVSYAQSCDFRGRRVPHLVVQSEQGPVTVMVLAYEKVSQAEHFDEQGYHGMIVPVPGHGSLAVITRGLGAGSIQSIAQAVMTSVQWRN